jgi:uncharacterized RDD family membrane protein YckC
MGNVIDFAIFAVLVAPGAVLAVSAIRRRRDRRATGQTAVVRRRVVAHIVDWLLIGVTWVSALTLIYHLEAWAGIGPNDFDPFNYAVGKWGFAAIAVANFLVLQAATGYTVGKRALGLRTVAEDGGRASAKAVLVRSLPLIIEQLGIVALIAMMRSPRHQRFGDRWAHTLVVRDARAADDAATAPVAGTDAAFAAE